MTAVTRPPSERRAHNRLACPCFTCAEWRQRAGVVSQAVDWRGVLFVQPRRMEVAS